MEGINRVSRIVFQTASASCSRWLWTGASRTSAGASALPQPIMRISFSGVKRRISKRRSAASSAEIIPSSMAARSVSPGVLTDLRDAEALALGPHQHRALREHRLADGEAGKDPLLEQEDTVPLLAENGGEHRATEIGSKDGYVKPLLRADRFHDRLPSRKAG